MRHGGLLANSGFKLADSMLMQCALIVSGKSVGIAVMARGITLAPCALAIKSIQTEADKLRIDARCFTAADPHAGPT